MQDIRDIGNRFLLILIHHLCIYLSSGKLSMTEQLAHGIDVRSEVEHHCGECMPSAMECDFLVYLCPQYPLLNSLVRA